MKTKYEAKFTFGTVTRESHHAYRTAAVAVKDGVPYWGVTFSKGVARAKMPGDVVRASARAACYNSKQKATMMAEAEARDAGYVVEICNL
jgi:hypothetical protein